MKKLFICPGDCNRCNLTIRECPQRGQMSAQNSLLPNVDTLLESFLGVNVTEMVTFESVAERWGASIFQAMQALEILREQKKKVTKKMIFQYLMDAIKFPQDAGQRLSPRLNMCVEKIVGDLSKKVMLIIKRKCNERCSLCCLVNNCTQYLESQSRG